MYSSLSFQAKFDAAAAEVKQLKAKPEDAEMLKIYALFKQASMGDNSTGTLHTQARKHTQYNVYKQCLFVVV